MMNNNIKYLSFALFVMTSFLYFKVDCAGPINNKSVINKWICSVVASDSMLSFENKILVKLYDLIMINRAFGEDLATEEYQKLGKEAQMALKIPRKYHVPIKKFPITLCNIPIAAVAMPGAILVNEERLKSETYGAKRSALFHEAIHKKYNDGTCGLFVELSSLLGSSLLMRKLILFFAANPSKWLYYPAIFASALTGTYFASSSYSRFIERRADTEGHYATQCSECVQESADRRRNLVETEKNPLKNNGYLFADALDKIASDLRSKNKLCNYHRKLIKASASKQPL